jgi:hypothetical protein
MIALTLSLTDDVGSVGWGAIGATTSCCGETLTQLQKNNAPLTLLLSVLQQTMRQWKRGSRPLLQKSGTWEGKLSAPEPQGLLRELLSL